MNKRVIGRILGVLCVLLVLLAAAAGYYHFLYGYTWLGSARYARSETQVDLSGAPLPNIWGLQYFQNLERLDVRNTGMTTEEYAQILGWHPECEILWSVPFQGSYVDNNAQSIRISVLSEIDIQALENLPHLKQVDASKCQDYAALQRLVQKRPDLDVRYEVELSGKKYAVDSESLSIRNGHSKELMERLRYLPDLQELVLKGKLPSVQELKQLAETYPSIQLHWEYRMGPVTLSDSDREVSLSGVVLENTKPLEEMLSYAPELEKAEILGSGLTSEELGALQEQYPDIRLIWDVTVGGKPYRTDAKVLDFSGTALSDTAEIEAMIPYMPDLEKVDMCGCGLSNEEMAGLNRKYENVNFVWMINIGDKAQIRTDATYFYPYKLNIQVKDEDLTELKYCTEMVCIDVGHMPIYNCEWAADMHKLKYLIIADTMVDSLEPLAGLESLIFLETFLTAVTDYTPLLSCPNLEDLNLCYTSGDPEPLTQMTWLKRLWWGNLRQGPTLPRSTLTMLREALPDTQVEFTGGSTASGWRNHQNYRDMRDVLGMFYLA